MAVIFTACKLTKPVISFIEPQNGAIVKNPVKVKMGAKGIKVQPAGSLNPGTGHHHILVDLDSIESYI